MATERSDAAYGHWLEASQKFDYFVVGGALALVSYLGSNNAASAIGWNPGTLQLASATVVLLSAACGLKKAQTHLALLGAMQRRLYLHEMAGAHAQIALKGIPQLNEATGAIVSPQEAAAKADIFAAEAVEAKGVETKLATETERVADWRDRLLILGLLVLVAARWMAAAALK
jgi:hypothetical protein